MNVVKRFVDWLRQQREWRRQHEAAWRGLDEPDDSGLTPFQRRCETAVREYLAKRGMDLTERSVDGEVEPYITARLGNTPWLVSFDYSMAHFTAPDHSIPLEMQDFRTPDELIARLLHYVEEKLE